MLLECARGGARQKNTELGRLSCLENLILPLTNEPISRTFWDPSGIELHLSFGMQWFCRVLNFGRRRPLTITLPEEECGKGGWKGVIHKVRESEK